MSYLEELLPEFRKGAKIRLASWDKGYFVYFECGDIWNTDNELVSFSGDDLTYDSWEFYKEPEPDLDYIIKNKCLCYFSNYDYSANYFGYLKGREEDDNCFIDNKLNRWNNCRPVRRDEVTFYEDRKDVAED